MRSIAALLFATIKPIRSMMSGWFSTIRIRLYIAFGFAAALTIVGSLTALYEFTAVGNLTNEMRSRSFPATIISLRLAEQSSSLIAAPSDKERAEIMTEISQQAELLANGIARLRELGIAKANEIDCARAALIKQLGALDQAVKDRIIISKERRYLALSIRKAHEDLLNSLAPAIDDANFDLMMRGKTDAIGSNSTATLESLRRLLEMQSEANLLAGLLTEASLADEASQLRPLADLIASAKRKIETNLGQIANPAQQKKLGDLYKQLAVIGGEDGIIDLRTFELKRSYDAQAAFVAAQSDAMQLKDVVDVLVNQQAKHAQTSSRLVAEQLRAGQVVLIALALLAIAGAVLIAWLYVGRNIARRLGLLSDAMRRIADGDLQVQVQDGRDDEIADMARALQVFRQATADATAGRQNEIQQADRKSTRRQMVEAATQSFETAVSNIVQTLDRASKTMDSSAREMADNASRNREKALATTTASQQATANVKIVAAGAE